MHPVGIESDEKIPNAQLAVVIAMPIFCHRDVSDARTKRSKSSSLDTAPRRIRAAYTEAAKSDFGTSNLLRLPPW